MGAGVSAWGASWGAAWAGAWGLEEEKPDETPRRRGGWRLHGTIGVAPVPIETPEDFLAQLASVRSEPGRPLTVPVVRVTSSRRRRSRSLLLFDSSRRAPF